MEIEKCQHNTANRRQIDDREIHERQMGIVLKWKSLMSTKTFIRRKID